MVKIDNMLTSIWSSGEFGSFMDIGQNLFYDYLPMTRSERMGALIRQNTWKP
jgi:hypothetical protein